MIRCGSLDVTSFLVQGALNAGLVGFFVLVLSFSGTRTRTRYEPGEHEYEYHFIEYERPPFSATLKLARRDGT